MSQPTIPPRPQRAQGGPPASSQAMPQIPPRPIRNIERSPSRDTARSPLNEPPTAMSNGKIYGHSNLSASELPARPPSVSAMPTVGQEGSEYASFDTLPSEAHGASKADEPLEHQTQTRHADVPMLQPTASVPVTTAKDRIQSVTRTDSSQAAAAGIGKPRLEDDVHITPADSTTSLNRVTSRDEGNNLSRVSSREPRNLRERSSFNRSSSNVASGRPPSVYDSEQEQGIPEIGLQVPMYPNAGDVQAPSPGPGTSQFPSGIGFFNDGSSRNHHRKRSSRHEFGPPGSYGLHGHPGQEPSDQFEREWIMKHPDIAAQEGYNAYGGLAPRPSTAMSSAQLNKLVHSNPDLAMGASSTGVSTPPQEVGWEASEAYTSRMNSPRPSPAPLSELKKRPSSGAQPPVESPLRKTSFPFGETAHLRDDAVDSEDDTIIHVDGRSQKKGSKVTGGGEKDNKVEFRPDSEIHEHPDGAPILAADEIEKRPGSAFLQPAVSPEAERSDWLDDATRSPRRGSSTADSRPGSRTGLPYNNQLSRFISHEDRPSSGMGTPLEEIEEYEPLFPEDDDNKASPTKKFKTRPGLAQHQFPSKDVWEDTPDSLQFTTSVETPEPPQTESNTPPAAVFETPEQEKLRRQAGGDMTSDSKTFAKPHFKSGPQGKLERQALPRFPSQDIWEDTPDSMRLETTVSAPQEPEIKSPQDERPTTTALASSQDDNDARATTGMTQLMKPHVPSRPARSSKLSQDITPQIAPVDPREKEVPDLGTVKETSPTKTKAPSIPERPKPTIPARPTRSPKPEEQRSISPEQAQAPAAKVKPAVPARPAGGKFANLKSGFMSDLASRIQLGPGGPPPKPKEPEPEVEEQKAPLADARKSRAKGPQRRKPAASPSGAAASSSSEKPLAFSFSPPVTVFQIDASEILHVPSGAEAAKSQETTIFNAEKALEANATSNASEAAPAQLISSESQPEIKTTSPEAESVPEVNNTTTTTQTAQVGSEGDEPAETISAPIQQETEQIRPTLEAALAGSEPAPKNAEEAQEKVHIQDTADTAALNVKPAETGDVAEFSGVKDPSVEGNVVLREGEEVGTQ